MEQRIKKLEDELTTLKQEILVKNAVAEAKLEIYRNIIKFNTSINLPGYDCKSPSKDTSANHPSWTPIQLTLAKEPKPEPEPEPKSKSKSKSEPEPEPTHVVDIEGESDVIMNKIKINKNYSRNLVELQKTRASSFSDGDIEAYKQLCERHKDKLLDIFAEKGFSDKKIESQLRKALTSFEVRLIRYVNYYNTHLEVDEVKQIGDNLTRRWVTITESAVFSSDSILREIHNYGMALFPLKTTLTRVLFHPQHGPSIIYRKASDSYSFYTLDSVDGSNRKWVMDCRLEEFTTLLKSNLYPYCVSLFKQIYKDVFGDNVYRSDYKSRCQLTELDCEQLLTNILILSSNELLNGLLQQLVKDTATIEDESGYTYNIKGDDNLQKRRWKEFRVGTENFSTDLFDTISSDEVEELKLSRN
jgi:hypothetical protein